MTDLVLSFDPGTTNAGFAVQTMDGEYIISDDLPTNKIKVSGKNRVEVDILALEDRTKDLIPDIKILVIEKVWARPGEGVTSSFRFGESFGILKGLYIPKIPTYCLVPASVWKKEMGLIGMTKRQVVEHVTDNWDDEDLHRDIHLVKHHNRAEAFLLGEFGRKHYLKNSEAPLWQKHSIH